MAASDESMVRRLGRVQRADALEETKVLAELEHRLFGRDIEPVRLGRFVLLERLGSGGFGSVYLAYDPQLDRKVAIKVLHGDGEDEDEHARLLVEAQALARFSHPNVVAVYDVGEFDPGEGSPARIVAARASGLGRSGVFVVMEFVEGTTLGRWLAQEPREPREILDIFAHAGQGLAAAHAHGIVHRDFKPDNVVVGHDGRARILDFGLAWRTATDRQAGGRFAGTLVYASPEQLDGAIPDARADQYAFALSLFEALHGALPFRASDVEGMRRAKNTRLTPSTRPSAGLPRSIRSALGRALAPDPEERFPDMPALLEALGRHRRRRVWLPAIGAAAAVGVGVAASIDASAARPCADGEAQLRGVWDPDIKTAVRARFLATGVPDAEPTWTAVEAALDRRVGSWQATWVELCRGSLDGDGDAPELRADRLLCLDRDLRGIGVLTQLFREADAMILTRAVESVLELPPAERCATATTTVAAPPEDVQAALAVEADIVRADELGRAGLVAESLELASAAVVRARGIDAPETLAAALLARGGAELRAGDYDAAEVTLRAALDGAERADSADVAVRAMAELVRALVEQGEHDTATGVALVAEARIGRGDVGDAATARLLYQLGILRSEQGLHEVAATVLERGLALARSIYGTEHPVVAQFHNALGNAYEDAGRYGEALGELELALAMSTAQLGPRHPQVALALNNLGNVHGRQGDMAAALEYYQRARATTEAWMPGGHPRTAVIYQNLAPLLAARGELDDALVCFTRALELRSRDAGPHRAGLAGLLHGRAFAHLELGHQEDALRDLEQALDIRTQVLGPRHVETARSLDALGEVKSEMGRLDDALEHHERALEIRRELFPADHPEIAISCLTMADTFERLGRHDEARTLRERALEIRTVALGADHPDTQWAHDAVARSRGESEESR